MTEPDYLSIIQLKDMYRTGYYNDQIRLIMNNSAFFLCFLITDYFNYFSDRKEIFNKLPDDFKNKEQYILTITENGFGKRSSAYEYRVSGRGGQGIINILTSERNGLVASTFTINHEDQIMLITDKGQAIRCNVKDIRITGRNTQGVRVFSLAKDEKVVSAARIEDATEENC